MPKLLDLFDIDFDALQLLGHRYETPGTPNILCKLAIDNRGYSKYLIFYIPDSDRTFEAVIALSNGAREIVPTWHKDNSVVMGTWRTGMRNAKDFPFTGRVYFYCEHDLSETELDQVYLFGDQLGLSIEVRQSLHVINSIKDKATVFISYDSGDKDSLARPLAIQLSRYVNVWFDEFQLKVGQNVRRSIEHGLTAADRCILLLTPNYIMNHRWAAAEYDAILDRHVSMGQNVILPVWHNISAADVQSYSPILKSIYAIQWDPNDPTGLKKVSDALVPALFETDRDAERRYEKNEEHILRMKQQFGV